MQDFTKLEIWRRSHRLSLAIYRVTVDFPRDERFGMTRQIRTAATSVEFNIAEGAGRRTDREFANFLAIASGSLSELQCQLILAHDLGWLTSDVLRELIREIIELRRMIAALMYRVAPPKPKPPSGKSTAPVASAPRTESERRKASRRD